MCLCSTSITVSKPANIFPSAETPGACCTIPGWPSILISMATSNGTTAFFPAAAWDCLTMTLARILLVNAQVDAARGQESLRPLLPRPFSISMSNVPLRSHSPPPDRREYRRQTPAGEPRGFIQPHALDELWFHTGTACNLACPFCLEGSKPGDERLQLLRFQDAVPFIDEALTLGVKQFSFTGGEPFINKDIIRILDYALQHKPCLVLTNATEP